MAQFASIYCIHYRKNVLPANKTEIARKVFKSIVCFKPMVIRNYLRYTGIDDLLNRQNLGIYIILLIIINLIIYYHIQNISYLERIKVLLVHLYIQNKTPFLFIINPAEKHYEKKNYISIKVVKYTFNPPHYCYLLLL